jgi:hypothetical protein
VELRKGVIHPLRVTFPLGLCAGGVHDPGRDRKAEADRVPATADGAAKCGEQKESQTLRLQI